MFKEQNLEQEALLQSLQDVLNDKSKSLQEQADFIENAILTPLKNTAEGMSKVPLASFSTADQETLASIGDGFDTVAKCAYAAGVIARMLGSEQAEAFGKIAKGSMMACGGIVSMQTGGFSLGGAALFIGGMLEAGEGLADIFGDKDEPGPNPIMLMLEQIALALAQISQQIMQLGQYIEKRFDRLEKILDENHRETLKLLRTTWYDQKLSGSDVQAIFKRHYRKLSTNIHALREALDVIRQTQLQEVEIRIADRLSLTAEFHFLQGLLNRDLVNEIANTMRRPDELLSQFDDYSRRLMLALTVASCRGSASLTGGDLAFDFTSLSAPQLELLRSRWLINTSSIKSLQTMSAYHIDALIGFAKKHGAMPQEIIEPPNLVLLKDRVKTFLKLYNTYVEKKKTDAAPRVAISASAHHHLEDVATVLQQTNQTLQGIDVNKVMKAAFAELSKQQKIMQEAVKVEWAAFEKSKTQELLTQRSARLSAMVPWVQGDRFLEKITIPEENNLFSYQLKPWEIRYKVSWYAGREYPFIIQELQEMTGSMLNVTEQILEGADLRNYDSPGCSPFHVQQHSAWDSQGIAMFQQNSLKWNPIHRETVETLTFADHLGKSPDIEQAKLAIAHAAAIKVQKKTLNTSMEAVAAVKVSQESISLLKNDYFNFTQNTALAKLYTLGPRLVRPAPGSGAV